MEEFAGSGVTFCSGPSAPLYDELTLNGSARGKPQHRLRGLLLAWAGRGKLTFRWDTPSKNLSWCDRLTDPPVNMWPCTLSWAQGTCLWCRVVHVYSGWSLLPQIFLSSPSPSLEWAQALTTLGSKWHSSVPRSLTPAATPWAKIPANFAQEYI